MNFDALSVFLSDYALKEEKIVEEVPEPKAKRVKNEEDDEEIENKQNNKK